MNLIGRNRRRLSGATRHRATRNGGVSLGGFGAAIACEISDSLVLRDPFSTCLEEHNHLVSHLVLSLITHHLLLDFLFSCMRSSISLVLESLAETTPLYLPTCSMHFLLPLFSTLLS